MSKKQERIHVLSEEILSVQTYLRYKTFLPLPPPGGRKKNANDSISYRQKGNIFYKSKNHNEKLHELTWRTYTQSIALAPNESEELACGYGNRSALLFHLKKFRDCIKDCDRALNITKSDILKMKLLSRKAESLILLNKSEAEDVAEQALQYLGKLQIDREAAKVYDTKLKEILSECNKITGEKDHNSKLRKKYTNQLSDFPHSEEAPCASKSIAIKYSKKLGSRFARHIVATEDIRPGEIFSIEKNYYTYISREGMYLYCSNCAKSAWSSIPCEHCIFDVYCSESCRSEVWKKYHQWECIVYPHIWDIDENVEACLFIMRFTFSALTEVDGIDNMKKLLMELDKCDDPITKGFSEGVFHVDSVRSIYSFAKINANRHDPILEHEFTKEFCIDAYLLAKHTTFFGQKMDKSMQEIFKNKDVVFFAALLLHSHHVLHFNAQHQSYLRNNKEAMYATTVRAFSSLFKHDCDPNVELFIAKCSTTIGYAIKPIKKGTPLTVSYCGKNFMLASKESRQDYLKNVYKFHCKCSACTGNWSSTFLPKLKTMNTLTPELKSTIQEILDSTSKLRKIKSEEEFVYSPKMMRDIVFFLESLAEKVSTHCDMYKGCLECLEKMFYDVFGSFHSTIPEKCFTS